MWTRRVLNTLPFIISDAEREQYEKMPGGACE